MSKENAPSVSQRAMYWRTWLAESPISDLLLPIEHTDSHNTVGRLCAHLESGGSAVVVPTHPSIEDIARAGKFLSQWPAIRSRRLVGPAAVHQMPFVEVVTKPFDIEKVPVVTQHSLDRKPYGRETIAEYLRDYSDLIVDSLSHNSLLVATSQADQMSKLTPPTKPVIEFILQRLQKAGITNILFVPMGIEIKGMRDYSRARKITPLRHTYIFHVGQSYTDQEIRELSKQQGMTTDYWFYTQQLPLVPPEYRSE